MPSLAKTVPRWYQTVRGLRNSRAPLAPQPGPQLLGITGWTFGEHADWAHTDHDLAGWMVDGGNLDPILGEADVNGLSLRSLIPSCVQNFCRALLAMAAPWTSPWLLPGYEQNSWNAQHGFLAITPS